MTPAIYALPLDNILHGAVVTSSVPPLDTYNDDVLGSFDPAARVRWGVTSVNVVFTRSTPAEGQLLVLPMHNLAPGSTTVLTITNNNGFSHAITIPAKFIDGRCPVLTIDLTPFANAATRTASVWTLVIASNTNAVTLGGFVAIYGTIRTFSDVAGGNYQMEFTDREQANSSEAKNEYGTLYVQDYDSFLRQIEVTIIASPTVIEEFRDWFRASRGRVNLSFFWPEPETMSGALVGRWQAGIEIKPAADGTHRTMTIVFDEAARGETL